MTLSAATVSPRSVFPKMLRPPFFRWLTCHVLALALGAWTAAPAEEPTADPLIELTSHGTTGMTVFIKKSDLAKMKLEQPVEVAPNLTVTHASAGLFEIDTASQKIRFIPTQKVPFKIGGAFGWLMKVSTTYHTLEVSETFTLPKKNGTWTVDPNTTTISEDGLSATTTDAHPLWDTLWRMWTFEDGDPQGPHSFEISLNKQKTVTLKFEVTAPSR